MVPWNDKIIENIRGYVVPLDTLRRCLKSSWRLEVSLRAISNHQGTSKQTFQTSSEIVLQILGTWVWGMCGVYLISICPFFPNSQFPIPSYFLPLFLALLRFCGVSVFRSV
jgi:hypothetical protein